MLIARPLARCDSLLVAAPSYLQRHGAPQLPQDLAQHRCLSHANFGKSVWHLAQSHESEKVSVVSHFSANEATALMQAAIAGGGIAMLPTYLANPHVAAGALQVVLPDWQAPALTIYALYPSRRNLSPAVRSLLDYLVERFETVPW